MRNLPRHYPHNNVYSLFPFSTPSAAVGCLKQNQQLPGDIDHSDYDFDAPKQPIVHTLTTRATISHVLNAPETYHTPYGEHFKKITDGYGYVAVTFQGSPWLSTSIVTFLVLTMRLCSWLFRKFFHNIHLCLCQSWPRPNNGNFIHPSLVSMLSYNEPKKNLSLYMRLSPILKVHYVGMRPQWVAWQKRRSSPKEIRGSLPY